jgi:hypothetical protein
MEHRVASQVASTRQVLTIALLPTSLPVVFGRTRCNLVRVNATPSLLRLVHLRDVKFTTASCATILVQTTKIPSLALERQIVVGATLTILVIFAALHSQSLSVLNQIVSFQEMASRVL